MRGISCPAFPVRCSYITYISDLIRSDKVSLGGFVPKIKSCVEFNFLRRYSVAWMPQCVRITCLQKYNCTLIFALFQAGTPPKPHAARQAPRGIKNRCSSGTCSSARQAIGLAMRRLNEGVNEPDTAVETVIAPIASCLYS